MNRQVYIVLAILLGLLFMVMLLRNPARADTPLGVTEKVPDWQLMTPVRCSGKGGDQWIRHRGDRFQTKPKCVNADLRPDRGRERYRDYPPSSDRARRNNNPGGVGERRPRDWR
jgi:hypothetical protein